MTRLLDAQNALHPGDHLVTRRIGRLVKVEVAQRDVVLDVSLERRASFRKWRVVAGANVQLVEVLKYALVMLKVCS